MSDVNLPVYCITHDRVMTPHSGGRFTCSSCAQERDRAETVRARARIVIDHVAKVLELISHDTVPPRKDIDGAMIEMGGAAIRLQLALDD